MKPERWRQIEQMWDAAIDLPRDARHAFLDGACADDEELRREVAALFAAAECGSFLEEPAILHVAALLAPKSGSDLDRLRRKRHSSSSHRGIDL